jgi:hypothetical protein
MVNFSSARDMETKYDEEQRLSIEITEAESNEEIAKGETKSEESEIEEEDDDDDNDNGNNNNNGDDDALGLPGLPDIDLDLP